MVKIYNCFLNIFGALFAIAAVLVWVVGGFALTTRHYLSVLDSHNYGIICGSTLLATGVVFFIVTLTVFHETLTKRQGCICTGPFQTKLIFKLLSFFSISATVVVALVATAGLTVVLPIKIDYSLKKNIYDNFNKYGEDDRLTEDINGVQKTFQCCGIEGYSDWLSTNYGKYPISCCINETFCINVKQIRKEQIYEPGCGSHLHDFFYSHFIYMVGGSVSLITIFLFCFVVACVLMKMRATPNTNY